MNRISYRHHPHTFTLPKDRYCKDRCDSGSTPWSVRIWVFFFGCSGGVHIGHEKWLNCTTHADAVRFLFATENKSEKPTFVLTLSYWAKNRRSNEQIRIVHRHFCGWKTVCSIEINDADRLTLHTFPIDEFSRLRINKQWLWFEKCNGQIAHTF